MAKTQWHPAFCAAMRLELKENPALNFINEFNLTEKPLAVDMLIINKESDVRIDHPVGEFFKKHNLLEYKSPTDHDLNEYAVYQALSYAYYYCDRYRTKDITVSLVASRAHFNLLNWMKRQKIAYDKRHEGIYTLHGMGLMDMQLVVTDEMDKNACEWLSSLTDQLTEKDAKKVVTTAHRLKQNEERRLAEAVLQVLTSANGKLFEKLRGDETMASALMELMRPEVEKYAEKYAEDRVRDYAREKDIEHAEIMIRHGSDNDYIRLLTHLTDQEIDELRKSLT